MITKYLLVMGIGHVLGVFYFTTKKIAEEKKKRYTGVIKHSIVYLTAMFVAIIPVLCSEMALAAAILSLAHYVVGSAEYVIIRKRKNRDNGAVIIGGYILHVVNVFIMVFVMTKSCADIRMIPPATDVMTTFGISAFSAAKWILIILIIHTPTNLAIQSILSGYRPAETDRGVITADNRAGRMIGTIERLIMVLFIALEQYAALGLVLTAKSIARYDKIAKEPRFAEYYLLGTLLSTMVVVLCRVTVLKI